MSARDQSVAPFRDQRSGTTDRRSPRQVRSQVKVERILDAAAQLLESVSVEALSVKLITDTAGVAPATFYDYFSDRDAVLRALAMRYVEETEALMGQVAVLDFESWEDATDAVLDAYIDWFRSHRAFQALWSSGAMDRTVILLDRAGNAALAAMLQSMYDRLSHNGGRFPEHAFRFMIEFSDRMLRYGFESDPDGDDLVFGELKLACRAYMNLYRDAPRPG